MKKKLTKEEKEAKKAWLLEIEERTLSPNIEARRFCFSHQMTVYPGYQSKLGKYKVFMQHFERFKPLDNRLYDPWDTDEQKEMYAIIDKKYEELYEKHKHKGLGEFYPPKISNEGDKSCSEGEALPSEESERLHRASDNPDVARGIEALKRLE